MRIRALRLARFRLFDEPIALEGFDAGLNIFAGANESGKSTLFAALEALFLSSHTRTGAGLEAMRPRGGGEPLIEADFETGGASFRIRKQFGRGRSATLRDLTSGTVIARSGEAEAHLGELIGASREGPGRVGLVWVHQQRALVAPDPDLDPETRKLRPRGEREALSAVLSEEVVEAAGSETAEAILQRARSALDGLISTRGPRKDGAYDLALREQAAAHEAASKARADAASCEMRLKRIADLTAALDGPEAAALASSEAHELVEIERRIDEAKSQRAKRDELAAESEKCRLAADNARQALAAREQAELRTRELSARRQEAHSLEQAIASHAAELNRDPATPARLGRLLEIERAIAVLDATLQRGGTRVELALRADAAGKVAVDGAPAAGDARYIVNETLTLSIDAIGEVRITAADAEKAAQARLRRDVLDVEFRQALQAMGASGIEDAKLRVEQRQKRAQELDTARTRLAAIAPKGVGALNEELSRDLALAGAGDLGDLKTRAEDSALVAAAALRAFEAARAAASDDGAVRKLASEWETLKKAARERGLERERMTLERERLKGEQANFDEAGHAGEVEATAARLQRAGAQVARIESEIAALRMLAATLEASVASVRARYFEPVSRAIAPYLAQLFPHATIDLKEGFSLRVLKRADQLEEFETLSDGTREQLSVLVRMGFARVLAERGDGVPLVLDDPLVYSDDERLAAMCRAFEEAATSYQVVLLTCRRSAFQNLTGRRLEITNWRPED